MSLVQQITDLALRIASQNKQLATWINGNSADLGGLNTLSKANLVAAINEVKTTADNAANSGGAKSLTDLTDVSLTSPASGHLLRHDGTRWINELGSSLFDAAGAAAAARAASQPLNSNLTSIASLATTSYGRNLLTLADQGGFMGLIASASETVQGKVELATQAEVNTGTDTTRVITPATLQSRLSAYAQPLNATLTSLASLSTTAFGRNLLTLADSAALTGQVAAATDGVAGKVELATVTEAITGTDSTRAVTPAGLKAVADAKVNINSLKPVAFSGLASDLTGTLNTAQLPALAVISVQVVPDAMARLALTNVQPGDIAKQTNDKTTWMLASEPASVAANWVELEASGNVLSVNGKVGTVVVNKVDVGLANVDNTSDANKPISTAVQTALNAKAPINSPTFTGTVSGITKAMVGLGNVDNTSDADKPVSSAQQAAINGRQPLDATLTALAGLTTAANQLIYATGSDSFSMTALSPFGRSLIDDGDAATARATLDVHSRAEIGNPETNFVAVFEAGLV